MSGDGQNQPAEGAARADVWARLTAFLLFGAAAAAAALAPLWLDGSLTVRSFREVGPLAAVVGGGLGAMVTPVWPRNAFGAATMGVLTALVGVIFFCGLYLFAEGVIAAAQERSAGEAIAAAVERLGARLPLATPFVAAGFAVAGLAMRALGGLGRAARRRRAAAPNRPSRARKPRRA